jgi:hypothetical protein
MLPDSYAEFEAIPCRDIADAERDAECVFAADAALDARCLAAEYYSDFALRLFTMSFTPCAAFCCR